MMVLTTCSDTSPVAGTELNRCSLFAKERWKQSIYDHTQALKGLNKTLESLNKALRGLSKALNQVSKGITKATFVDIC